MREKGPDANGEYAAPYGEPDAAGGGVQSHPKPESRPVAVNGAAGGMHKEAELKLTKL